LASLGGGRKQNIAKQTSGESVSKLVEDFFRMRLDMPDKKMA